MRRGHRLMNEKRNNFVSFPQNVHIYNVIMILCFHEDNNFSLTRAQYNIVILLLLYPHVRAETAASRYASGCLKQYFFCIRSRRRRYYYHYSNMVLLIIIIIHMYRYVPGVMYN